MFSPTPLKRTVFFIIFDIILSFVTLFLAYQLRFNFDVEQRYLDNFLIVFFVLTVFKILSLLYVNFYNVSWKFISLFDAKKLLFGHLIAYSLFLIFYYIFPNLFIPLPRSVFIIDIALSFLFLGALRISKRLFIERGKSLTLPRTLVIGVSSFSQTLLKEREKFNIVAIVDSNKMLINSSVMDIVVSSYEDLEKLIKNESIESVVIANQLSRVDLNRLYNQLNTLKIENIKILSLTDREMHLEPISVEDLLARKPKDLDKESISSFVKNKVIMITGAGGSIGSELSKQVVLFGAKRIILLDHSEYNLYQISESLKTKYIDIEIVSVLLSVKNKEYLEKVFQKYSPEVVLHAAAYKHVPLCEENIYAAIENNVFGTKNVIDLSVKYEVKKTLLISTDKAVRPTNVMGTTKRICELYAHAIPSKNTEIVAVRFGNVLGSSGSVIPKFRKQIEEGRNITVTHPDITRYFMLIPEACQLVLQAASIARGGELFILDMGDPIKIVDLAKKMIELSGSEDIEIEFTGLRPGEKLYEELLLDDSDLKTKYDSIMVAQNIPVDYKLLCKKLDLLKKGNHLKMLKDIVPEFDHRV